MDWGQLLQGINTHTIALKMDTKRGYYSILLSLIDKLFEGEIDQQTFEECVRYIFGGDAYIMFTIDKLVLSLVRDVGLTAERSVMRVSLILACW